MEARTMTCRGRCGGHAVHKPIRALSYIIGGQRFKIVLAADDLAVHVLHDDERDAEDVRSGAGDRAGNRNIGVGKCSDNPILHGPSRGPTAYVFPTAVGAGPIVSIRR
jgi:hypothetical protein